MTRDAILDAATVLARVTALGKGLGRDLQPLVTAAAGAALAVERMCRVGIDRRGARVRLLAPAPGAIHALALDVDPIVGQRGTAVAACAPRGAETAVELADDGDIAFTVLARWTREHARAAMAEVAPRAVLDERAAYLDVAGVRAIAITARRDAAELQLAVPTTDAAMIGWLAALAEASGAPRAQVGLVESLGPVFAHWSHPVMIATLHAGAGGVLPRVGLTWRAIPFDLVLRVLVGLGEDGDAAGRRVGALAGAFDTDVATTFELVLGAAEADAWIAIDVVGGKVT